MPIDYFINDKNFKVTYPFQSYKILELIRKRPIWTSKPFLTIDEQLKLLKSRNLIIEDDTYAKNALLNYSYYDLINGLGSEYFSNGKFKQGITLKNLVAIHLLDKSLKSILLNQIISVERSLKTKLSYVISESFGINENDYLKIGNYSPKSRKKRRKTIESIKKTIANSKSDSIKNYREKHTTIPLWIAINDLTLGNVEYLYQILKSPEKSRVTKLLFKNKESLLKLDENKDLLFSLIDLLRKYRNICAHNKIISSSEPENIMNKKLLIKAIDDQSIISSRDIKKNNNGIFICIIAIIMLTDDYDQLTGFFYDLFNFYDYWKKTEAVIGLKINQFNLPHDFPDRINLLKNKFIN